MLRERLKGTADPSAVERVPEDSVFLVYVEPKEGENPTPHVTSIWLTLSKAKEAAERVVADGHPWFASGFRSAYVTEMQVGEMFKAKAERHGDPIFPPTPAAVSEVDRLRQEIAQKEAELAMLRSGAAVTIGVTAVL